jgi:hypothetical protein
VSEGGWFGLKIWLFICGVLLLFAVLGIVAGSVL